MPDFVFNMPDKVNFEMTIPTVLRDNPQPVNVTCSYVQEDTNAPHTDVSLTLATTAKSMLYFTVYHRADITVDSSWKLIGKYHVNIENIDQWLSIYTKKTAGSGTYTAQAVQSESKNMQAKLAALYSVRHLRVIDSQTMATDARINLPVTDGITRIYDSTSIYGTDNEEGGGGSFIDNTERTYNIRFTRHDLVISNDRRTGRTPYCGGYQGRICVTMEVW